MEVEAIRSHFWEFQKQGRYTDVTVAVDGREYRCHKLILAATGGFWESALTGGFEESLPDCSFIDLRMSDPANIFGNILKYIYCGDTSWLTTGNALHAFIFAVYLNLRGLEDAIERLFENINSDLVEKVLARLVRLPMPLVPQSVIGFMASHFYQMVENEVLYSLPTVIVQNIFRSDRLRMHSEAEVVRAMARYHAMHKLSEIDRETLGECVVWQNLSLDDWDAVDWRPFIREGRATKIRERVREAIESDRHYGWFSVVLNTPHIEAAINRLTRYVPPRVEVFPMTVEFFENPAKYHVVGTGISKTETKSYIEMKRGYGLFLEALEFSWEGTGNVQIVSISGQPVGRPEAYYAKSMDQPVPDKSNKIRIPMGERELFQKVYFTFTIAKPRFRLLTAKAQGFTTSLA